MYNTHLNLRSGIDTALRAKPLMKSGEVLQQRLPLQISAMSLQLEDNSSLESLCNHTAWFGRSVAHTDLFSHKTHLYECCFFFALTVLRSVSVDLSSALPDVIDLAILSFSSELFFTALCSSFDGSGRVTLSKTNSDNVRRKNLLIHSVLRCLALKSSFELARFVLKKFDNF